MIAAALAYWTHDLDPVAFHFPESWGLRGVHWYGLAYAAGFLVAAFLLGRWRRAGITPLRHALDESTLMTAVMVGVITGGRLGHVLLYARDEFAADPMMLFRVWQGGMASHGGFFGVLLAGVWFARRAKIDFLSVGDLLCALAPAGLLFGRLANFVNGELVGNPSYEAFGEGLLPLLWVLVRYPRRLPPGRIAGEFLLLYSAGRIVSECFRSAQDGYVLGLTAGQFWTLPLAALGLFLVLRSRRTAE